MKIKRNLKSLNNKTGKRITTAIKNILSDHEKYQGYYFWTQTNNASGRRQQEFTTELTFTFNNVIYEITQDLRISCKNFYYSCDIRKNNKKSNITCLKKLVIN